jgi:chromate transporter
VKSKPNLLSLCQKILWVGCTGFGGPLVTLNMLKQAFVQDLAWLSEKDFLERMGMCKLLPGPVSSMMSAMIGKKFFGFWGSLLAIFCFLLPAFLIVVGWMIFGEFITAHMSEVYSHSLLWVFRLFIVAAIFVASIKLLIDTWRSMQLKVFPKVLLFLGILLLAHVGVHYRLIELEIMSSALFMGLVLYRFFPSFFRPQTKIQVFTFLSVFGLFFLASVIVFGTGFMLFPYLERELVQKGLLSQEAFQSGILLGNLSPGPVVIASTYYGWKLAGFWGALAATIGVFSGPFILVNVFYSGLERLRRKPIVQYLSLCIVPAVVLVLLHFNLGFMSEVSLSLKSLSVLLLFFFILWFKAPLKVQVPIVFVLAYFV